MSKRDTALLRQALEQLEINRTNFRRGPSKSICKMLAGGNDDVIAALRAALAEPVQKPLTDETLQDMTKLELLLRFASRHPGTVSQRLVQKPVAWMTHSNDLLPLFHATKAGALNWAAQATPLYTAPPQHKPLTNAEINTLIDSVDGLGIGRNVMHKVARAIEAAHGIEERCPNCNGPADNGHDRGVPPSPYYCTKCMGEINEPAAR